MTVENLEEKTGAVSFTVSVLWLFGMSVGKIALRSGRTSGSIRGIVHRQFKTPRDEMTIEERAAALDELKANRKDGGHLPDKYFSPIPLARKQAAKKVERSVVRPLHEYMRKRQAQPQPEPEPDTRTREGRKEALRRKKEAQRAEMLEKQAQILREQGGNERRGVNGSALEYLHFKNILSDPSENAIDVRKSDGLSSKERRKEAGIALRDYLDGCRVGGLSGIDFGAVGGGSGGRLSIPEFRLRCLSSIGAIRKMMKSEDYEMIEGIVDRDEFPWEHIENKHAKTRFFEEVRRCLDVIAVAEHLMERQAFFDRWGYYLEFATSLSREAAREQSSRAEEVLRAAR